MYHIACPYSWPDFQLIQCDRCISNGLETNRIAQMFLRLTETMVPLVARKPEPQSPQLVFNLPWGASNDQSPRCMKPGFKLGRNMYGHLITSSIMLFADREWNVQNHFMCLILEYASGKALINASQISGCVFHSFPFVFSFLPSICCSFPFLLVQFGTETSPLLCSMQHLLLLFIH